MAPLILLWLFWRPCPVAARAPALAPASAPAKNPDAEIIKQLEFLQYLQMKKDAGWLLPN
jgi:hypothetical protein